MQPQTHREAILAFAAQLASDHPERSAAEIAQERDWLDGAGEPTALGRQLVEDLEKQNGARSSYRLIV